jgi:hypothetical protein
MAKWIAATIGILTLCCVAKADVERGSHEGHSGSVIVQWNQLAYDIAYAEDQFTTFKGQRAIAMVHLAQHDALNAIVRRFEPYQIKHRVAEADPIAASAQAGREILIAQYPTARAEIDALLTQQLAMCASDLRARELGIQLGRDSAKTILELRADDARLARLRSASGFGGRETLLSEVRRPDASCATAAPDQRRLCAGVAGSESIRFAEECCTHTRSNSLCRLVDGVQ